MLQVQRWCIIKIILPQEDKTSKTVWVGNEVSGAHWLEYDGESPARVSVVAVDKT